jgi:Mechanosensitive ion channel
MTILSLQNEISRQVSLRKHKPNIVFIMGDDIGMWNIGAYHRGIARTSGLVDVTRRYQTARGRRLPPGGEPTLPGLFGSVINTPDNVRTIIGNNKIFSDTIQNFSANPHRRVDLVAQLSHSVDHKAAIRLLKERLSQIPNVLADPAPTVEILEANLAGPVLCMRPHCNNDHYWQVYFDTNRLIRETFGEAGFPAPGQR